MTDHDLPPEPPSGAPQVPAVEAGPAAKNAAKNTVGRIALGIAIAGAVFACIPGALIVGWVLLPVAFILGVVGLTRRGQAKAGAIAAVVVSVVGTIVGAVVFFAVVANAVDDAFDEVSGGTTGMSSQTPAADATGGMQEGDGSASGNDEDGAEGPAGTREDPYPFDAVVANDDWSLQLSAFDADADAEIAAASGANPAPEDGQRWITVDASVTYTGSDNGSLLGVSVDYVTADGTVISPHDTFVMGVEPDFDSLAELYEGATEDGRLAMQVPNSVDGLFRVSLGLFADEVFVALPDGS